MTEIEILEQEIAQKQLKLKLLKEQQKPHFNYDSLYACLDKYDPEYISIEGLKNHIRGMAKYITTAHLELLARSKKESIFLARTMPNMEQIGAEKIAISNEFIKEISPIVGKYIDKFIEMNKEKKIC